MQNVIFYMQADGTIKVDPDYKVNLLRLLNLFGLKNTGMSGMWRFYTSSIPTGVGYTFSTLTGTTTVSLPAQPKIKKPKPKRIKKGPTKEEKQKWTSSKHARNTGR